MSNGASDLRNAILGFRKKVDEILREQRVARTEIIRRGKGEVENNLKSLVLSGDLVEMLNSLRRLVRFEHDRYVVPELPEGVDGVAVEAAPAAAIGELAPAPTSVPLPPAMGTFTRTMAHDLGTLWRHSVEGATPQDRFIWLFDRELANMTGEAALLQSMGVQFVPKLKKASEAMKAGRFGDALTILKTALRNDPHNHTMAFIVSQMLYMQAGKGQRNAHPEARDLAQRAMIPHDKLPDEVLAWYRYHSICCEMAHSPERALEWLRETDLLNPKNISGREGWLAENGCFIKAWFLLAEIPIEIWGEREFASLQQLVWRVVGGGALYLMIFRPLLIQAAATKKEPLPHIEELEDAMGLAYQGYLEIAPGFEKLLQHRGQATWLVRSRLLEVLATLGGRPAFDHVMLHITLDGESWQEGAFPDGEIQAALEDYTAATWRWWAMALTPLRELHLPSVLPVSDAVMEISLGAEAEQVLLVLSQEERSRMREGVWDKVSPWMVRWELDHLLAAGSGTNKPRMKFAPTLPPYSHFYRRWSDPAPTNILGSEIIAENARRGAFASWYEVLAAFEGAWRLIDDPVHGLIATQKRALAAAKAQDPNRFAGLSVSGPGMDFSKLGVMLVPLGLIAGVVVAVSMTRNIGQAIGVILVLAGLAGVMAIQITKQK